ncbi:MAG TPA: flavin reductase family protein [Lichenihabitans sp.]|jgi:flavin reductase (DIM6/NTAB) family NADH-FMN oxidoreductase RutF|nr:flavin reductase family protein [Lichenihabitans sp.]
MNVIAHPRLAPTVQEQFRQALQCLAGGVTVVTAGAGEDRTGLVVTSACSLSLDPARMLVCVNRRASAWPIIQQRRHLCFSVLAGHHQGVAERFAGRGGVKGAARYEGSDWTTLGTGALGLRDALAVIDCDVEEILERHSHGIVIGAVRSVRLPASRGSEALVYAEGRFASLGL